MTPAPLLPGDPAPPFVAPALDGNPHYSFATAAGRYVVLLFLNGKSDTARAQLAAHRSLFDDERATFFGVSSDPADVESGRIAPAISGVRFFLDPDNIVARLYGAEEQGYWLLLDPCSAS